MIEFEDISFKNFLSFGNQPSNITFNSHKTTLFTGKNGHGKSTLLDALTFVLYGKPFRKIKKGQLVNTVNKKQCLVDIRFKSGPKAYEVKRGIKPNIFEIYEDGEMIPQDGSTADYQAFFEKNVLKMDYVAFTQVVILGKATYKPFMRLNTPERRPVVEDLLGLSIFSAMNKILKKKVTSLKLKRSDMDGNVRLAESAVDAQRSFIEQAKLNRTRNIEQIKENIGRVKLGIESVDQKIANMEDDRATASLRRTNVTKLVTTAQELADMAILEARAVSEEARAVRAAKPTDDVEKLAAEVVKLEKKRYEMNEIRVKFGYKADDLLKEIEFLTDRTDCPTCKQEIHADFREAEVEKKTCKHNKLGVGKVDISSKITKLEAEIKDKKATIRKIGDYDKKIASEERAVRDAQEEVNKRQMVVRDRTHDEQVAEQAIVDIDSRIVDVRDGVAEQKRLLEVHHNQLEYARTIQDDKSDDEKMERLQATATEAVKKQSGLADLAAYYATIGGMLRDSGIKTLIVNKYLPIFNSLINKYLNELGFFVRFELDEEFNETILSRFRDTFSYASFSEGQKLRIDLAILLTWREIAKRKNSLTTNLLIMDEVFDSSLDSEGVEAFIDMIPAMENTHIFVISHTPDKLTDRFSAHVGFEMDGNFSVMKR